MSSPRKVLATARTYLREFVPTDSTNVLSIFSNPRSMAFAPMPPTTDRAIADSFILWHINNYSAHGFSAWAVIQEETGLFIGQAGLIPQDVGLEIFYSFLPAYWNQGIATEVAFACRDYAFQKLQVNELISIIHPRNESAIRVAQKIGMKQNGTIAMWNRENALYQIHRASDMH